MSHRAFVILVAGALAAALALRAGSLDQRPMHHDEANQGVRFGHLLETGEYRYDRTDHHGPTLYYLTLPAAWLRGQASLAAIDERTLRIVPVVFGAGLLLLLPLFTGGFGRPAVAAAAWLAALSPALTYYGRFYIQETLFAFFTLAFLLALGRYVTGPRASRAVWVGVWAGLAYATKETSVIVIAAGGAAALLARRWEGAPAEPDFWRARQLAAHVALALGAALAVAVTLYSSFFTNPAGFLESIRAYGVYVGRGVGNGPHTQPWYHYLQMLTYWSSGGLVWSEALIVALAALGIVAAALRANGGYWPRYVALYSMLCLAAYSVIRYKTPWNLLPFYVGFVVMAGNGVAVALAGQRSRTARRLFVVGLAAGCVHLGVQSGRAAVTYGADPRNPYAYVHTVPDLPRLAGRIHDLAAVHPDGSAMLVKVVAGTYEQWPLPWYLRRLVHVGYWNQAGEAEPLAGTPVLVASLDQAPALDRALGDAYVSEYYGLRPDVLLALYVERPLWERFLETRGPGAPAAR